ncbi:hypothetical protein SAMN04488505_102232 [Chitinophaga rupis]|uniref:Uncharacterized protein n=1 Tax=Chitinophaga rupis TaxID=573321 RepID=A0A1H7Q310_9BACT|nr:hypothetical protein [Chitinophaga rupis]SEL42118.1 hypothetical protein SAMN04488505_102232 [Chitinophaga rupis]
MPHTPKDITWYEITKDLIIPFLGVITTIVIGTIIAYLLKSKEEKAKIKTLLIDNYMLYLDKKMQFFEYELTSFKYQIFKDIFINYEKYFEQQVNNHFAKEKVAKLRDTFKAKLDSTIQNDTNWSPFTYRFAFLLGKKNYDKHVQSLEDSVVQNYIREKARSEFLEQLKTKIAGNKEVVDKMNSLNTNKIVDALDDIEYLISITYNDYQFRIFNPFDTRIANLIDKY